MIKAADFESRREFYDLGRYINMTGAGPHGPTVLQVFLFLSGHYQQKVSNFY